MALEPARLPAAGELDESLLARVRARPEDGHAHARRLRDQREEEEPKEKMRAIDESQVRTSHLFSCLNALALFKFLKVNCEQKGSKENSVFQCKYLNRLSCLVDKKATVLASMRPPSASMMASCSL